MQQTLALFDLQDRMEEWHARLFAALTFMVTGITLLGVMWASPMQDELRAGELDAVLLAAKASLWIIGGIYLAMYGVDVRVARWMVPLLALGDFFLLYSGIIHAPWATL